MIPINELRIGNLVSRSDLGDGTERFETILELGVKTTTSGPIRVLCAYDEINPIPLTRELMLKLGFDKAEGYWNNGMGYSFHYDLENQNVRTAYPGPIGTMFPIISFNIKSVHQLQNLYFALTGEELTIKEIETQ